MIQIGVYQYNPQTRELAYQQQVQNLPYKTHTVLMTLLEAKGEIVSREQLIDEIWQGNFLVGDKALTQAIWSLRKCFKHHSSFIETIPKEGYVARIPAQQSEPGSPGTMKKTSLRIWIAIAVVMSMFALMLFGWNNQQDSENTMVAVTWHVDLDNSEAYWTALETAAEKRQLSVYRGVSISDEHQHNVRLLVHIAQQDNQQTLRLILTTDQPYKMQSRTLSRDQLSPQIVADEALALFYAISL